MDYFGQVSRFQVGLVQVRFLDPMFTDVDYDDGVVNDVNDQNDDRTNQ